MNKLQATYFTLFLLLLFVFCLNVFYGPVSIDWLFFIKTNTLPSTYKIILEQRILSSITALLSCAILSLCGMYLQILFKNPLAGPSVLGISSGSMMGMSIFILISSTLSDEIIPLKHLSMLFSLTGALSILLLLLWIHQKTKSAQTLLLAGIMISFGTSAVIDFLKLFFQANELQQFTFWSLSSFQNSQWSDLFILSIFITLLLPWIIQITPGLNLYDLGDEMAQNLGLNVPVFQKKAILITGILISYITSICGPIAFIGLIIPQLVKLLRFHAFYEHVSLMVILLGAIAGILVDFLSKNLLSPHLISVNTISSLIGIPIVFYLLYKKPSYA